MIASSRRLKCSTGSDVDKSQPNSRGQCVFLELALGGFQRPRHVIDFSTPQSPPPIGRIQAIAGREPRCQRVGGTRHSAADIERETPRPDVDGRGGGSRIQSSRRPPRGK